MREKRLLFMEMHKNCLILVDAVGMPSRKEGKAGVFQGRIINSENELLKEALRSYAYDSLYDGINICVQDNLKIVGGTCLYLGHFAPVYGHALLESLSRFWALDEFEYDHIVFHQFIKKDKAVVCKEPIKTALSCYGVGPEKIFPIDRCMKFEKLIVPEAMVDIFSFIRPEQRFVYQKLVSHCHSKSHPRKIYLSRRNLGLSWLARNSFFRSFFVLCKPFWRRVLRPEWLLKRAVINEAEVEKIFKARGFEIIYPEKMNYVSQVSMYGSADVLAGFEGSAMHNSVFMRAGTTVLNIESIRTVGRVQKMCDKFSEVNAKKIEFKGEVLDLFCGIVKFDISHLANQLDAIGC